MNGEMQTPAAWTLRPRDDALHEPGSQLPRRPLLIAVARRSLPRIIEASLVPAAIFLLTSSFLGSRTAMLAVLVCGCVSVAWRKHRGASQPALVVVAMIGLTVRTLVGLVSGSTFVYFAQPIATMVAIATVFFLSVLAGRPLVARIAHDFCPIAPDVSRRPAVVQFFGGLTVLWAGAQLVTAGTTLGLLLSLDTSLFVVVKPIASLAISGAAIAVTIRWALRITHREDLVFATA